MGIEEAKTFCGTSGKSFLTSRHDKEQMSFSLTNGGRTNRSVEHDGQAAGAARRHPEMRSNSPGASLINPRSRATTRQFQRRFLHRKGGAERWRALIFSQSPASWRLPK
jgi:hypothetical protein